MSPPEKHSLSDKAAELFKLDEARQLIGGVALAATIAFSGGLPREAEAAERDKYTTLAELSRGSPEVSKKTRYALKNSTLEIMSHPKGASPDKDKGPVYYPLCSAVKVRDSTGRTGLVTSLHCMYRATGSRTGTIGPGQLPGTSTNTRAVDFFKQSEDDYKIVDPQEPARDGFWRQSIGDVNAIAGSTENQDIAYLTASSAPKSSYRIGRFPRTLDEVPALRYASSRTKIPHGKRVVLYGMAKKYDPVTTKLINTPLINSKGIYIGKAWHKKGISDEAPETYDNSGQYAYSGQWLDMVAITPKTENQKLMGSDGTSGGAAITESEKGKPTLLGPLSVAMQRSTHPDQIENVEKQLRIKLDDDTIVVGLVRNPQATLVPLTQAVGHYPPSTS